MKLTVYPLLPYKKYLYLQILLIKKEFNSLNEKQTLNNLYFEYKKLGENGIINNIRDKIDKIPIKKDC